MKAAILVDEIAPGSAPKLIGQPIKGLEKMGHRCEGLILVNNGLQKRFSDVYNYHLNGARIRYLFDEAPCWFKKIDFKFPGFSFFSLHHILSFIAAPLIIKRGEYDIVIAHNQYAAFTGWGLRIFRGIPYLLIVWDPSYYTLRKVYKKTWLRYFYPLLDILAVGLDIFSTRGARALITSGQLHHRRFKRISGRPLEDLYPGCFPKGEFIPYSRREKAIVTYDRWDIGNKPNIFLDLLENIDPAVKLLIGGFWHPEEIEKDFFKEVERRKLQNRIELLGPLDENKILEVCSRTILHIHTNEESFGMQTLEAAACGCCIIIPKGSGVTDLFRHGVHGFFPKKDDFSSLVNYIKIIFSDIKKAEEMGRQAWQAARNNTWSRHTERLNEIINKYV